MKIQNKINIKKCIFELEKKQKYLVIVFIYKKFREKKND